MITYSKLLLLRSLDIELEDGSIVLVAKVTDPQGACLSHKLVLQVQVPVLVLAVKLEVLALGHVVNCHYTVVSLHRVVLDGIHRVGNHLLKMVHLMDVLSLVPNTIRLVHEDKVLVLRVDHLANVVEVHVLEEDEDLHDVGCM